MNHYHPENVGTAFVPDIPSLVAASTAAKLPPAQADDRRVMLLLVDPQIDFIHADGALSVPGAVADTRRTIEWIYNNIEHITAIAASLDSHIPSQIFFPTWWKNAAGAHPDPFTPITSDDVEAGRWTPVFEEGWSRYYVHELESAAKKELMIWPYHTLIGTPGHTITPALYEAIAYHAAGRQSPPTFLHKGAIPKTEHYSLLEPEVKVPDQSQGTLNTDFLHMLAGYDLVYVAGQAKSHCVLETVTSVMNYYADQPDEIAKWRVLTDCMSSVAHPAIDFEALAMATLHDYAARGLTLVTSQDAIG
ncbi:MAG: nicotinamidase [Anaerolineae bacterium]|nr:nicotinamidase [Anaerolineae bacterium]